MNEQDQRIAIAEACGNLTREHDMQMWPNVEKPGIDIPDYPNDHNALASARDQCINTPELRIKWVNTMRDVVGQACTRRNKLGHPLVSDIDLLFATPAELAETLLKTLKLWVKS